MSNNPVSGSEFMWVSSAAMLKPPRRLERARAMRHLSVPSQETQRILSQLKAESALPEGARVQSDPSDSDRRLIPVNEGSETDLLSKYPVILVETKPPLPRTYRDHLPSILSVSELESIEWPSRHEFIGDLILIKLDNQQRTFGKEIGQAPVSYTHLTLPTNREV